MNRRPPPSNHKGIVGGTGAEMVSIDKLSVVRGFNLDDAVDAAACGGARERLHHHVALVFRLGVQRVEETGTSL